MNPHPFGLDPKSSASASFATSAFPIDIIYISTFYFFLSIVILNFFAFISCYTPQKIPSTFEGCFGYFQWRNYFITSLITFAKYFMLFKHWSIVFPVAPTSIIHAAFAKCWLYLLFLNIIGLNNPGYSSFAFSCTFIANFKFSFQFSCSSPSSVCSYYKHNLCSLFFSYLNCWCIIIISYCISM